MSGGVFPYPVAVAFSALMGRRPRPSGVAAASYSCWRGHPPLWGGRIASLLRLSGGSPPALALGAGPPPLPLVPRSLLSVASLPRSRSRPSGCGRCAPLGERYFGKRPCRFPHRSVATLPPVASSRSAASLPFFISLRSPLRLPAAARSPPFPCSIASQARCARLAGAAAAVGRLRFALVPRASPAGAPRCGLPTLAPAGCGLVSLAAVAGGVPPRPPAPPWRLLSLWLAAPCVRCAR